jgi:hypothetical protein
MALIWQQKVPNGIMATEMNGRTIREVFQSLSSAVIYMQIDSALLVT